MSQYHMDEIDEQIIHALMSDARNTSAPMIAENLSVSAETVRNRIDKLEANDVIRGYAALVDFERVGRLTSIFMCTVPADRRERLARMAQNIQGVINVRVLMAGRRDLQIVAVGETTEDLREIARILAELDIQIEDEELLQTELNSPYSKFGPGDDERPPGIIDTVTTGEEAMIMEVDVTEQAPTVGLSPEAARRQGILPTDVIVLSIERDGRIIQPVEDVRIESDDVVTLLPRETSKAEAAAPFLGENRVDSEQ
jgi:DNA-binding Lrp family transcriptional regulator